MFKTILKLPKNTNIKYYSTQILKDTLEKDIPLFRNKMKELKSNHGSKVIGEVTIDQCINGSRGIKSLFWEPSLLDANDGIRIRNLSINECQDKLPSYDKEGSMMPEGMLWLLLTGNVPNKEHVNSLSKELLKRTHLKDDVIDYLKKYAKDNHPMNTLSGAISLCQNESHFMKAYQDGVPKDEYWRYTYEDTLNIIAKLPLISSMIYNIKYRNNYDLPKVNHDLDYSGNFCTMMGFDNKEFHDLMRLYLSIHSDHEGGNASAHTTHLVSSTLADPYISYASGLNALAGPLHGLANAEVLKWIQQLKSDFDNDKKEMNRDNIYNFVLETLNKGQVIPGFGHAVLRKTDPRYTCQRQFALKHLPNDELFNIVEQLYQVVPEILIGQGKVKNPYPNVDNHSGILLYYYGMKEYEYYTVLFGVSRAMGALSQLLWDRALQLPIERPKSMDYNSLVNLSQQK